MGLSTQVTVTCDYSECKVAGKGPAVVQWNKEQVESGLTKPPEESKYLVLFTRDGVLKTFCCQLHAAEYFLPPGYEARQKQLIEFPAKFGVVNFPAPEPEVDWKDLPPRSESPVNGQSEDL